MKNNYKVFFSRINSEHYIGRDDYSYYYPAEFLQYLTGELFNDLEITLDYVTSQDDKGNKKKTIQLTINKLKLKSYNYDGTIKQDEDGNGLMFAIIQGLKMGMILSKKEYNIDDCTMAVIFTYNNDRESDLTPKSFYLIEGFDTSKLFGTTVMELKQCQDKIHFYWHSNEDKKSSEKFERKSKYPLIAYDDREHLFVRGRYDKDRIVATKIKYHVESLILDFLINSEEQVLTIDDILFQTVFNSYKIDITSRSRNLDIDLKLNQAFMGINYIIEEIIKNVRFRCKTPTSDYGKRINSINNIQLEKVVENSN